MDWKKNLEDNLLTCIIPFWDMMVDSEFGAFYGECSNAGVINKTSLKGSIYLSRLLWSYSQLYKRYKEPRFKEYATSIFEFIDKYLYDHQNKGIMFSCHHDGVICDNQKHLYAQSFFVYGASEYYSITNDVRVLKMIEDIYQIVETNLIDFPNNYHEAYSFDFKPIENKVMIGHNMIPEITTNTILHLAEGFSSCFVNLADERYQKITGVLVDILFKYGYDEENANLYQFLDYNLVNQLDVVSYGHNIEVSWLFKKIILDTKLNRPEYLRMCRELAVKTIKEGFNGFYLNNEKVNGVVDESAIWWVQAECLIGFDYYFNSEFAVILEEYLKNNIYTELEWIWGRDQFGKVISEHNQAEMWKANYHNIRAVLEITGEKNGE